jgi:hypothetical protein
MLNELLAGSIDCVPPLCGDRHRYDMLLFTEITPKEPFVRGSFGSIVRGREVLLRPRSGCRTIYVLRDRGGELGPPMLGSQGPEPKAIA